ncbi:hypothetical protein Pan44_45990 [Caulifigura coniformis]|uniref:Secreted protein n=1 Tax=Caulifigura coniformis TaxID=2527983 RepID=A0A517SK88_9PLAN|nr:hypothetical protein [Caulifigura coniformis]QDT56543.1 hypothetical protein Pan44_45990 [Caulifigura coniformis]
MRQAMNFSGHSAPWACLAIVGASLALPGCGGAAPQKTTSTPASSTAAEAGHDHDHPSEGPHHGDLVELGNEEYHAEIVHGAEGSITVYILDGSARNVVPIESTEVVLNLAHDGKPDQFHLPAAPQDSDGAGKSSKFHVVSAELARHLDDENSNAKLVVTIAGKQFTSKVEHHHDHDHSHK